MVSFRAAAVPVVQNLQLLMHLLELLKQAFGALELGQLEQHRFDLLFTADQHSTLAAAWLVGHQSWSSGLV